MIDLLIEFIVFVVIVALALVFAQWVCKRVSAPEPFAKGLLWVLGAFAVIAFLVRFIKPLVGNQ